MPLLSPFGLSLPSDRHVPTSWFHTTSPVYSAHQVSSLLHPETGKSSLRFQVLPPPSVSRSQRLMGDGPLFPLARFTPFEEFPSPVAVPHHCGRCLLAVMSLANRSEHRNVRPDRVRVPTSHHNRRHSRSRSHSSAPIAPSVQSPSLAIPSAEATGPGLLRCVCLLPRRGLGRSCHPSAEAPGCEIRFPTPPKLRCSPSLPAQCRMSPNGDCEGVSTR